MLGDLGELWLAQTRQWTARCQPQCPGSQWFPPGRADTPSLQRTGNRSCCHSGVRRGRGAVTGSSPETGGAREPPCLGEGMPNSQTPAHHATLQTCWSCFLEPQAPGGQSLSDCGPLGIQLRQLGRQTAKGFSFAKSWVECFQAQIRRSRVLILLPLCDLCQVLQLCVYHNDLILNLKQYLKWHYFELFKALLHP